MQYENVFKVIRVVHVILAFLKSSPAAQTALKTVAALGTGTPPKDQRLLTNAWPKTRQQHKHTCIQRLTLRNITSLHKTVLKADLELFYCNTRFIKGHKPRNHIRARIKSHIYTTEWAIYHSTYHVKRYNKANTNVIYYINDQNVWYRVCGSVKHIQ